MPADVQLMYLSPVVSGGPIKFSGNEAIRKDRARFLPSLGHSLSPVSIPRGRTVSGQDPARVVGFGMSPFPAPLTTSAGGLLFTLTSQHCCCVVMGPPHSAKRVLTQMAISRARA